VIVVDTNVVAELMRPEPHEAVLRWSLAQPGIELYTTAITVAEVLSGIERLPAGQRKDQLRSTATEVFATFEGHVLAFDAAAAVHYPLIVDARDRLGRPIDGFDAQIASICRASRSALATHNVGDFEDTGVEVVDPWRG
jgi:predicted nucleic acid-binding protein